MDYTSAAEIKQKVLASAEAKTRALAMSGVEGVKPEVADRFIEQRIATAHKQGKLMTDRQLADYRHGRLLTVGDAVKFIGDDRKEEVRINGKTVTVTRKNGQEGVVTEAVKQGSSRVVTVRPIANAALKDELLIELTVKEGTPGYLDLERQP